MAAELPPNLGSAANFAVLAGTAVTNSGPAVLVGDLGVFPGTSVTGFPPGVVMGTIHVNDAAAAQAQVDLTAAYDELAGRPNPILVSGDLGGSTLTPGLYKSNSSLAVASGALTLDAQGDPNAVFVFQIGSTLITGPASQVILAGGAVADNIYWQVGSSATFDVGSVFHGNILALVSITYNTGAQGNGKALARNGAVTLDSNVVNGGPRQNSSADLMVQKVAATNPITAGAQETYTIVVSNNGPEVSRATVVTDTLPSGATFNSAVANAGTGCVETNGVIVCSVGDLQVGTSATITVNAQLAGSGLVSNTASARHERGCDPDPTNDAGSTSVTVVGSIPPQTADLTITKTDLPDPVPTNSLLTYTIDVTNNGPSAATGVIISDTIPTGTDFVSSSAGATMLTTGVLSFNVGTLASQQSAQVTVSVLPKFGGRIGNTAAVRANQPILTPMSNTVRAFTTVTGLPVCVCCITPALVDVSIVKTATPDPVIVDQLLTYNLLINNASTTTADGILVSDVLPAEVDFVSAETSGSGTCMRNGRTITCSLGSMAPAETTNVQILVRPRQVGGPFSNTATVSSSQDDSVPLNNSSTAITLVVLPNPGVTSDLSITKTTQDLSTTVGQNVTYQVNVANNGPDSAAQVIVTDILPANSDFVSATPSQGTCSRTTNTLTCNLGTINSGADADIEIIVQATETGVLINTATVVSNSVDPNLTNNTSTAPTVVISQLPAGGDVCPDLIIAYTTTATATCKTTPKGRKCKVSGKLLVTNIGNAPADKTFTTFYLSNDLILDPTDTYLGMKLTRKLMPGMAKPVKLKRSVPVGVDASGKFVIVVADGGDTIYPECNEANNAEASGPLP